VELTLLDLLHAEVLVNQENSHVKGFRHESEFTVHVNDPLNKESA